MAFKVQCNGRLRFRRTLAAERLVHHIESSDFSMCLQSLILHCIVNFIGAPERGKANVNCDLLFVLAGAVGLLHSSHVYPLSPMLCCFAVSGDFHHAGLM